MDKYFAKLNEKQKQAVTYLEGPLLVLAGPGTGKTQLLSSRVAYILQNTDTAPENILCITFTEAGVSNMRERLSTIVGKDSAKINISTYHTFGRDIMSQYSNYCETYDRRLESPIDEITQQKIVREIQAKLPITDILRGDRVSAIKNSISAAKAARLTADNLAKIAEQNAADSEILNSSLAPYLEKITPRKLHPSLEDAFMPIHAMLSSHAKDAPIIGTIPRIIQPLAASFEKALNQALAKDSISPLTSWRNKNFDKDEFGVFRLSDRVSNKKLASLARIMAAYQEYLKENGLFDFNDMIEEAVTMLKTDAGFRMTISERYQFIMLDEFQDTNPSQFELIKQLTDYENPMVMAVGDDDQAIYEFQGASATSLSDFKNHYNAHVINLTENYRSTQEILDLSERIINQVDDSFIKTQPELHLSKHLHANKPSLPQSGISRHHFVAAASEYTWVADRIAELINSGVRQKDIAVIAPKHKYIEPLISHLKEHPEIHISYEKRDNLFEDPAVSGILSTLELVYNIANNKTSAHLFPEVLSHDFWQISPVKILTTFDKIGSKHISALDYLLASEDEELVKIANFFAALAVRSHDTPLELMIDYIIGMSTVPNLEYKSPFMDYYSNLGDTYSAFQLYESLSVLREKIRSHVRTERPMLEDLMLFLSDYRAAEAALTNTSPFQESADSVQVLSAHSSKGLEFEYVFLIAVDDHCWGKGKGNNNTLVLPDNINHIHHTGATDSERVRLLFVAITRAKAHLIMTSSDKDFSGKKVNHLCYLQEYLKDDGVLISPLLPEDSCAVASYTGDLEEAKKNTDLHASFIANTRKYVPEIRTLLEKNLESFHLFPTGLISFVDITYAGPLSFYESYILRRPQGPVTTTLSYGTLVHHAFEAITKEGISDEEAMERYKEEATKELLSPEEIAELSEKGAYALPIALKKFGKILRAENSKAEVSFSASHIVYDGIPLTGTIDHLGINEEEKAIEIYDFKTGKNPDAKGWWTDASLIRYLIQLNFYKFLVNLSPEYANYKVTKGHILFVNPDREGEVYDREYEYNDADFAKIGKLIKAVYGHIKALDFIAPDSPLAIEPDAERKAKDIKEFIDTLIEEA